MRALRREPTEEVVDANLAGGEIRLASQAGGLAEKTAQAPFGGIASDAALRTVASGREARSIASSRAAKEAEEGRPYLAVRQLPITKMYRAAFVGMQRM